MVNVKRVVLWLLFTSNVCIWRLWFLIRCQSQTRYFYCKRGNLGLILLFHLLKRWAVICKYSVHNLRPFFWSFKEQYARNFMPSHSSNSSPNICSICICSYLKTFCLFLQVIKMLVVVVSIFAICWLPWQTYMTATYIEPRINE